MKYFLVPTEEVTPDMFEDAMPVLETGTKSPDATITPFVYEKKDLGKWEVNEEEYLQVLTEWQS